MALTECDKRTKSDDQRRQAEDGQDAHEGGRQPRLMSSYSRVIILHRLCNTPPCTPRYKAAGDRAVPLVCGLATSVMNIVSLTVQRSLSGNILFFHPRFFIIYFSVDCTAVGRGGGSQGNGSTETKHCLGGPI